MRAIQVLSAMAKQAANLLFVSSSDEKNSRSRAALQAAENWARNHGHTTSVLDLRKNPLPLYGQHNEKDPAIEEAVKRYNKAQGVVFAGPVHNWGPSAAATNALTHLLNGEGAPYRPHLLLAGAGSQRSHLAYDSLARTLAQEGRATLVGNPITVSGDEYDKKTRAINADVRARIEEHMAALGRYADALSVKDKRRHLMAKTAERHMRAIQKLALTAKAAQEQKQTCSCGCPDSVSICKCGSDCECRQEGGSCYAEEKQAGKRGLWDNIHAKRKRGEKPARPGDSDYPSASSWKKTVKSSGDNSLLREMATNTPVWAREKAADSPAWTRAEGQSESGGLNAKGRASLKAQGHNIKAPVTEENPTGERAGRRASFCARMGGMKKKLTGSETANDPDSRINKALRKWNC